MAWNHFGRCPQYKNYFHQLKGNLNITEWIRFFDKNILLKKVATESVNHISPSSVIPEKTRSSSSVIIKNDKSIFFHIEKLNVPNDLGINMVPILVT